MYKIISRPVYARLFSAFCISLSLACLTTGCSSDSLTSGQDGQASAGALSEAYQQSFARKMARSTAQQLMQNSGGGRDLVADVVSCYYDEYTQNFEIDVRASWNGKFFRSNNYQVAGRISVNKNGQNGAFARTAANGNYRELKAGINGLRMTAALIDAVNDLSE